MIYVSFSIHLIFMLISMSAWLKNFMRQEICFMWLICQGAPEIFFLEDKKNNQVDGGVTY